MNLVLAGQKDAYILNWSIGGTFNHAYMTPAAGTSVGSGKTVRFAIRPGLSRADMHWEGYSNSRIVEKSTVWLSY